MRVPRFSATDPAAKVYFDEHGFVVLSDILSSSELDLVRAGWNRVVEEAATACGMPSAEFAERFPQNRDLWRKSPAFQRLLAETSQWQVATRLLDVTGVRLFHDHAICKPPGRSGTIPWHQDSAYWPLDRVGISLWTPTDDVPLTGGCLKVLDGSQRDGPDEPQDFLAPGRATRDQDPRRLHLPVARGETVVLDGLIWHGSDPNQDGPERLAYLTLWVPAAARFVPDHAAWHPTAAHIRVRPGERLQGEWFPLFGAVPEADEGRPVSFPAPRRRPGPSMFTASQDIAAQIAWLLGKAPGSLTLMLGLTGIDTVISRVVAAGFASPDDAPELRQILQNLVLQERVRATSVARDVYLTSVTRWWCVVGARIDEVRNER